MKTNIKKIVLFIIPLLSLSINAQNEVNSSRDLLFLAEFDNYDKWYNTAFKSDALRRSNYCSESKTQTGKINDQSSLIVLRDFEMNKMPEFTSNKAMEESMAKHNIQHNEVYVIESLTQENFPQGKSNLFFIVNSVDYDLWFWDAFLLDSKRRSEFCDEAKTRVAKINDKKAMVILYDFDMAKMKEFEADQNIGKLMMKFQVSHKVYLMKSL